MSYTKLIKRHIILIITGVVFGGMSMYDNLYPLKNSSHLIEGKYGNQVVLCFGMAYSSNSDHSSSSRVYLIFPQIISDLNLISITQSDDDYSEISEIRYGGLFFLFFVINIGYAMWRSYHGNSDDKAEVKITHND